MVFFPARIQAPGAVTKTETDSRLPLRGASWPVACVTGTAGGRQPPLDEARSLVRIADRIGLDRLDRLADLGGRVDRQLDQGRYLPFLQIAEPSTDGEASGNALRMQDRRRDAVGIGVDLPLAAK